jgi:hypothetical protein
MTIRKDFMLCPTGRGFAATQHSFGDAHLPVWHSTRTRISPHYQVCKVRDPERQASDRLKNQSFRYHARR